MTREEGGKDANRKEDIKCSLKRKKKRNDTNNDY